MTIEVKVDRRRLDDLLAAYRGATGVVKFGSVGTAAAKNHIANDGRDSGLPVATILAIHEYGVGVPERSVIREWVAGNADVLRRAHSTGTQRELAGRGTREDTYKSVGKAASEGLQRRIRNFIPPPLSPRTMANPDRDPRGIPLWDTGQILDSLGYEVES